MFLEVLLVRVEPGAGAFFGIYAPAPWAVQKGFFGNGEAFVFRHPGTETPLPSTAASLPRTP